MSRRHTWLLPLLLLGCKGAEPVGQAYRWPQTLGYRLDFVSQVQRNDSVLLHYAESKILRVLTRDGRLLAMHDSVLKSAQDSGGVRLIPFEIEDTLGHFVELGPKGEISNIEMICDPALPVCANALPSILQLELRRAIPRLPQADATPGTSWVDTLTWDDATKPQGTRGSVVTEYTARSDSTIAGMAYQVIGWRASRRTYRRTDRAQIVTDPTVLEIGITLIDRATGLPAISSWAGSATLPPDVRAAGATASGFRGRAYLTGTYFDSLYARSLMP